MCTERQRVSLDEVVSNGNESFIVLCQKQLDVARELGDELAAGNVLCDMAEYYCNAGQPEQALTCYNHALALAQKHHDCRGESVVLSGLGAAYSNLGNKQQAFEYHSQSLAIARELRYRPLECHALVNLGNTYSMFGAYGEALETYQVYVDIAHDSGDHEGKLLVMWNMALVHENQDDLPKARDMMATCLRQMGTIGYIDIDVCKQHYEALEQKIDKQKKDAICNQWWFW
jgi:tetratricopeptide (TPR) repeat protein